MTLDEIRRGLEKPGKSKGGLAAALGIDPAGVTRLLQGRRQLKAKELEAVRAYFADPITEVSEQHADLPGETISPAPMLRRNDMPLDVPVFGTAVGGEVGDFQLNGQIVDYVRRPPSLAGARQAFAIFYANDSMYPQYESGDPIYVNPAVHPRPGDTVLIEMQPDRDGTPGPAYVKRLMKRSATFVIVSQHNPPKDDIRFDMPKVKAIWRIVPTRELLGI